MVTLCVCCTTVRCSASRRLARACSKRYFPSFFSKSRACLCAGSAGVADVHRLLVLARARNLDHDASVPLAFSDLLLDFQPSRRDLQSRRVENRPGCAQHHAQEKGAQRTSPRFVRFKHHVFCRKFTPCCYSRSWHRLWALVLVNSTSFSAMVIAIRPVQVPRLTLHTRTTCCCNPTRWCTRPSVLVASLSSWRVLSGVSHSL